MINSFLFHESWYNKAKELKAIGKDKEALDYLLTIAEYGLEIGCNKPDRNTVIVIDSDKEKISKKAGRKRLEFDYSLYDELKATGRTQEEIAKMMGISKTTLQRRLRERQ